MATIHREIELEVASERAWDALRDLGALHTRLVPGFVVDVRMEEGARIVTFGSGAVVKEVIVTIDDAACRLVWSAQGGSLIHHNASAQVLSIGPKRCRFVWIADILPDARAPAIAAMIEQAMPIIQRTLEATG